MAASGDFIIHQSSRLHYHRWGKGEKLLLCFHGYGESAGTFSLLAEPLGDEFTIVAIDMPLHGKTEWNEGLDFSIHQLLSVIDAILAGIEGPSSGASQHLAGMLPATIIDPPPASRLAQTPWHLLGYSMGGRIALSLLEAAPEKIQKLILIAPDGLRLNPWYWLATQTHAGRLLFWYTLYHPGWFLFMLKTGNKLKLVNPSVYKFVDNYIGKHEVRRELYTRWTTMRHFRPHLEHIKAIIRKKNLPVRILYGKFDRIIREERGRQFQKGIEPWCRLVVLSAGHQLLQTQHLPALVSLVKE